MFSLCKPKTSFVMQKYVYYITNSLMPCYIPIKQ